MFEAPEEDDLEETTQPTFRLTNRHHQRWQRIEGQRQSTSR